MWEILHWMACEQDWKGICWLNPPNYRKIGKRAQKASNHLKTALRLYACSLLVRIQMVVRVFGKKAKTNFGSHATC